MGLGFWELIIILGIVFFLFGGRKIPEISRGIGLSIRNFKKGLHEPEAIDITPKKEGTPRRKKALQRNPEEHPFLIGRSISPLSMIDEVGKSS